MELIRTLSQMVNCLRSRGIRRKVAVVCPNDPHTEYVIIRSLREEIAEYLLVTDSAHLKEALDLRAASPDFVRIYEAGTPDEAAALAVRIPVSLPTGSRLRVDQMAVRLTIPSMATSSSRAVM